MLNGVRGMSPTHAKAIQNRQTVPFDCFTRLINPIARFAHAEQQCPAGCVRDLEVVLQPIPQGTAGMMQVTRCS